MLPLAPQRIEAADPVAALAVRADGGPEPERQLVRFRSAGGGHDDGGGCTRFRPADRARRNSARRPGEPSALAILTARRGRIIGGL